MSVYEIGIVFSAIGETPYDVIDRYRVAGVTFDEAHGSPLAQFLAVEFPSFDIEMVNFNRDNSYKNAVRLTDKEEREDIVVRLPKVVQMVEDYWPEMTNPKPTALDNWIVMSQSVDEKIDKLTPPPPHKPDWHPSYGHLRVVI